MKPTQPTKRTILIAGVASTLALTLGLAGSVAAQDAYPSKPVTLIVPYPAGGANDMLGRFIGQKLGERLKQQFVVENKPGAGTLIGASQAARATPDGYTLFAGGFASNAVAPHLFKADYDPINDFAPIGLFGSAPTLLATYNESRYKTLKDLVEAYAKSPNDYPVGGGGAVGSQDWMKVAMMAKAAKQDAKKMRYVALEGGGAVMTALQGGHIKIAGGEISEMAKHHQAGKLRILAVMAPQRLPGDLSNIPTAREQGYEFDWIVWRGYYVGPNVSDADYKAWTDLFTKLAATPEFAKERDARGLFPYTVIGADFDKRVKADVKMFKELAKDAGL